MITAVADAVAPGAIETDFGGGAVRDNPDVDKIVADMTALGRAGVPAYRTTSGQ